MADAGAGRRRRTRGAAVGIAIAGLTTVAAVAGAIAVGGSENAAQDPTNVAHDLAAALNRSDEELDCVAQRAGTDAFRCALRTGPLVTRYDVVLRGRFYTAETTGLAGALPDRVQFAPSR